METTQAVILRHSPYSETSLLIELLTRDLGVIRALAKGARRSGRQTPAAIEPFAWSEVRIALPRSGGLATFADADLKESWPYLRRDVDRLAFAALGLELMARVAAQSPHEPFHFEESVRFLALLEEVPGPGSLLATLMFRLLFHAGFPPHWAEAWTPETLPERLTFHFDTGTWAELRPTDSTHAMRLPADAVAPLLSWRDAPPPLEHGLGLTARSGRPLLVWLIRAWENHLNRPLKSAVFLEKMVLFPPEKSGA